MAEVNDVPQLVDKKGGSYAAIAPELDPGKFNKWKKRMLCYVATMEPYYLKCIKDGPFQPKTAEGHAKPESQWTPDERRVVVQDQRLKSIIMSCLPDDIMESVVSCVSAKETWTDLVHSFEGPSDTKKNRIIDLKLEYQTFRAKSTESLSQTYTRYKTMLNELANDGGLRNVNHTQTLDLANIYGRFVYKDNLIQRRYSDTKKALITTSSTPIFTAFFSNNVIQDFQENSDDEVDERSSEEYLRDLDIEYHERALLANTKRGEVFDEEEVTQVKVLMALADDELTVGKSHARNGEWFDITIRKSSIGVQCNTCGSTVHSTSDHNEFDNFKRGEKIQAVKRHIREPIWYLDNGCSRSMTGVKSYLHKYVEQPGPKFLSENTHDSSKQLRFISQSKGINLFCAVKRILRYLKGTPTLGLYYPKCSGFDLKGYSDSDYAGCNMDRKSTSGACQILGGKLVCWSAKKQQSVAMSSAEAEYVAAAGCCASILWMKSQLSDYDIHYKMVPIFCDNTSAIAISNNPVLHSRTKHIDIRYHFIRDHILKGDIELHFIPTEYQLADIFTKPLDEPTSTRLKAKLGMLNID
ncbi:hypothetical protein Tco_1204048 [Tanacetum coccineum]